MASFTGYDDPEAYIAGDRRRALALGVDLPDRVRGAALFADISGFTPLTDALVREFGALRGAEELSSILDGLFDALLGHLHRHGGSAVYFSGDAVTCWLDGDDGVLATNCALAMQAEMATAGLVTLPSGRAVQLAMKVAIAVGPARRFVVGDPQIQLIDVLGGALMDRLAETEHQARSGEVVLDESAVASLGGRVRGERRDDGVRAYLVVTELAEAPQLPPVPAEPDPLPEEVVRPWLLPAVYERLRTGRGTFLAELRTAVPLFLHFDPPDFDSDEGALDALDAFVVAAQQVVDGYGGSTLQLTIGDKGAYLYAVFGTPLAHEDDAARACAAALDLRALDRPHAVSGLQIGLARGRVRSGTYGHSRRRTFCCLGDAVNLAARLMSAAPAGEIYVSAAVQAAAGPAWNWNRLADLSLKGKAGATSAYALLAAERPQAGARHRRPTLPMVGRDDQLAVLETHIDELAAGHGRVLVVTAGAGLGKSRLLVEAVRLLDERGIRVFEGEAPAFGTQASYRAWHEIWAGVLGVPIAAAAAEQQAHLERLVDSLDPALVPRVPLLGAALGLAIEDNDLTASLSAKLRKASLEALLADLLGRLAGPGTPLAILIEDAQWLDPLSADLLSVLAQRSTDWPVLFVVAHRSRAGQDAVSALRSLPHYAEIELAELDLEACRAIVRAKLGQLGELGEVPEALFSTVLERAEGNPFYLEELLTFIHSQGVDLADASALAALDLPDSLHSLVFSRIDTLTEGPRSTAKVASVVGRRFATPMLRGVYPDLGSDSDVTGHLGALRGIDLIMLERPSRTAGGEEHRFKHVITAQAAYEATPAGLRESLHEQVGQYLEGRDTGAAAQLDLLAYHYGRSANLTKKREYLVRAGDRARTDYANAAAIGYYRQAVSVLADAERGPVQLHLGAVLELVGEWAPAEQTYLNALDLATQLDDRGGINRARKALAEVARKQGRYDEATELLRAAEAGFVALGDQAGVGEVLHLAGTLAAQQGAYDRARERYGESLQIRRALEDTDQTAALLSNLAIIAEYEGDLEQARTLNEQALALRLEVGNRWAIGVSQNNLGMIALLQADYADAVARFTETMRLNREVGDEWMVAIAHNNLGNAWRGQGDLDAAARHLGQSLTGYLRFADRWALAIVYEDIAVLAAQRNQLTEALTLLGAADSLRAELGSPRAPAQTEALDQALAPARSALGDGAELAIDAGRRLSPEAVTSLAHQVCAPG